MPQFPIASNPDTVARRGAVLVVEDRDDVRQGMAQLLELYGFLVEDARDAEEALTQLHTQPDGFALILLDLVLPGGLSGWDFRVRQLADPTIADIPTIVVAVGDNVDLERRDALRFDGWIEKPFRCADLLEAVRRYVVSEGSALQAES
jgi:CheY-like chemotaxis protein